MARIAFLVYDKPLKNAKRGRKEVNSFDGQSNIGSYMIKDILERSGLDISFCDPHTAKEFDIVLVSLASSFDVYNLLKVVIPLTHWEKGRRSFKVIVGGFGCQNVIPIRNFVDVAFFGRVDDVIAKDIREFIDNGGIDREYVMEPCNQINPVKLHQVSQCYPFGLQTRPKPYKEYEIGCPRKCLFCHYTFSRRFVGDSFQGNIAYNSKEIIFNELLAYFKGNPEYKGKIKTAIDGFSERLRMAFNKRYSDDLLLETFQGLSEIKTMWLQLYMIGSYPTETQKDRESFIDVLRQVKPKHKMILSVHTFPFRASPLTPSQFLPMDISIEWAKMNRRWCVQHGFLYKGENLDVNWTAWQDSAFTHLQSAIIERATADSDDLIRTIIFSKQLQKVKAYKRVELIQQKYDLTHYLREYHTEEQHPTWFLESYIPNRQLKKMGRILKRRLGMPETVGTLDNKGLESDNKDAA